MNLQMNTRNLDCVFEQLSDISPSTDPQEQYQYTVPILGGTGRVQRIVLRRGMEINWFEASLSEPVTMDVGIQYPHLEITYTLSGQGCWSTEGRASDYGLAPGVSNFIFIHDSRVHAELYPQERLWHMELRLDFRQFRDLHPDVVRLTDDSTYCRQTAGSPTLPISWNKWRNALIGEASGSCIWKEKRMNCWSITWTGRKRKNGSEQNYPS